MVYWRRVLPIAAGLLLACAGSGAAEPLTDSQRRVERTGTVLKYAIPAAALAATWLLEPRLGAAADADAAAGGESGWLSMGGTPRHDLLLAIGRTVVVTKALKYTVDETRPNGGQHSFPSGHTSMAFAGAEFLRKQYGWRWGAGAYLAAGFVGWSRVKADQHYTHDVLAGAAIGILANHDFWKYRSGSTEAAVTMAMVPDGRALVPGLQFSLVH